MGNASGRQREPKIYQYGKQLFPEEPARGGDISEKEEAGEGPTAHC